MTVEDYKNLAYTLNKICIANMPEPGAVTIQGVNRVTYALTSAATFAFHSKCIVDCAFSDSEVSSIAER